ncbi:hypothetical protein CR162_06820 [Pseudoroseomonas rhizosphaerae]|uniref:Uncharacterized protein n=1 Tax=Teichococcus rhizosphaerae TaxID=1335062 RepID=A0A2C7AER4_9PROT|nr:hypothetical protein CR162_06820 [Pseudoroseomonas rhizosphaerae]
MAGGRATCCDMAERFRFFCAGGRARHRSMAPRAAGRQGDMSVPRHKAPAGNRPQAAPGSG